MRKFLVVLLILSVMGGAFAQGEWSIGGSGMMGTKVDFHKDLDTAMIGEWAYHQYDGWSQMTGQANINYSNNGFNGFIEIKPRDTWINLGANYSDDIGAFAIEHGLNNILRSINFSYNDPTDPDYDPTEPFSFGVGETWAPGRLWGYYKAFDGVLHIEAAYKSRDTRFWNSSDAANNVFGGGIRAGGAVRPWDAGFTHVDGDNYGLLDFNIESLAGMPITFGVMLPDVFDPGSYDVAKTGVPAYRPFQKMIIGAKANIDPVEVALQFDNRTRGIYLGSTFGVAGFNIGLQLQMGFESDEVWIKRDAMEGTVGVSFGGGLGDFNFGVAAALNFGTRTYDGNKDVKSEDPEIGFNVGLSYALVPGTLFIGLDTNIQINNPTYKGSTEILTIKTDYEYKEEHFKYNIVPQIYWALDGNGGAGFWSLGKGLIFRYRLEGDNWKKSSSVKVGSADAVTTSSDGTALGKNAFDICFKWAF